MFLRECPSVLPDVHDDEPGERPDGNHSLIEIFEQHSGNTSDKWSHYPEIYERHLAKLKGQPVNLVEIGVFNGGSLQIWRKYFGGGYGRESFIEHSKRLIDLLHEWYWYNPNSQSFIQPPSDRAEAMPVGDFAKSTFGLFFYDSMLVIEKTKREEPWMRLYGQLNREEILAKRAVVAED